MPVTNNVYQVLRTAGTFNMIPLLNDSAYIWSKLCQL
jgi:hypothetical protein